MMRSIHLLLLIIITGCSTIPPESVLISKQVEKNLKTMRANNLLLLKEWRDLSIDYWYEKIAREGSDIILEKARKSGTPIDLNKDYRDLVVAVMNQYKLNYMNKIDAAYTQYLNKINSDFDDTENAQQSLSVLLQSAVKLDAERERIYRSAIKDLGIADNINKLEQDLKK